MKNQKGVTTMALVITVILMILILGTILYNSMAVYRIEDINDMYMDIRALEDKVAMYYLNYGTLPVKEDSTGDPLIASVPYEVMQYNPNDDGNYYLIDPSLLNNVSLHYSTSEDRYVINNQSHTIYYLPGVQDEDVTYYTIPIEYTDLSTFY